MRLDHVSQDDAADKLNVSRRSVQAAKAVMDKADPAVFKAVEQGRLAVSRAAGLGQWARNQHEHLLVGRPGGRSRRRRKKGAFCLPMDEAELKLFRAVAERDPPRKRVRELWCIVGRRGGKDSIASAIACFAAGFVDYRGILRPGEQANIMCLAVDRAQASIVQCYTQSYFSDIGLLRGLVMRETSDGLGLSTGAELSVLASNFRNVRGRSMACVVMDEVAFRRSETTASPDTETYAALVPSLATIRGAMLIGISTPYRRSGLLYAKWRDHFGQDDDDVLVVHGGSRIFNPTLPEKVVEDALRRDAAAARSEWLAEWRDDIAAFLSPS